MGKDLSENDWSWTGTWSGSLQNYPRPLPGSGLVPVRMEIGRFPREDGECSLWKTIYSPVGEPSSIKDYRLCRGNGSDDLFIDEGDGLHLSCRWIEETQMLISPFKYANLLLIAVTRLIDGLRLQEEIVTMNNRETSLRSLALQRLTLTRL